MIRLASYSFSRNIHSHIEITHLRMVTHIFSHDDFLRLQNTQKNRKKKKKKKKKKQLAGERRAQLALFQRKLRRFLISPNARSARHIIRHASAENFIATLARENFFYRYGSYCRCTVRA